MDGNRIKFISMEAQIEDSAGRRKFCLVMEDKLKEYEKRMLCGSQCPHILPMHILTEDEEETAYYDFTGAVQLAENMKKQMGAILSRENQKPVCSALDALSGILGCIKGMENYLIFPERITIHPDAIFIEPGNGKVALAFYPCVNPEIPFQNRILALIDEMNEACHNPETGQYFRKMKDYIHTRNPGLDGMIAMLGTMQREASYIYWNSKSLRRAEEKDPGTDRDRIDGIQETGRFTYDRGGYVKQNRNGKKLPRIRLIAIQTVFLACLAAAFLSNAFDIINLAGMAVVAAAIDLWILRRLQYIK